LLYDFTDVIVLNKMNLLPFFLISETSVSLKKIEASRLKECIAPECEISFKDAEVILLPVRSLKGVFTWITSPERIDNFKEDMKIAGIKLPFEKASPGRIAGRSITLGNEVVLEDIPFKVEYDPDTSKIAEWFSEKVFLLEDDAYWYWREKLKSDLVILNEKEFEEILSKIGHLPQNTILYSVAEMSHPEVKKKMEGRVFQVKEKEILRIRILI